MNPFSDMIDHLVKYFILNLEKIAQFVRAWTTDIPICIPDFGRKQIFVSQQ